MLGGFFVKHFSCVGFGMGIYMLANKVDVNLSGES